MKKHYKAIPLLLLLLIARAGGAQNATSYTIEDNNIRAKVNTAGLWFTDFGTGMGFFEAPKQPTHNANSRSAIYASTLWIGGIDPGSNVRMAMQTYRQIGNDLTPGPIDPIDKTPLPATNYDKFWRITAADYDWLFKDSITDHVKNWPASYTTSTGTHPLAPFNDINNNGIMEPALHEYPIFPGDEALFFVHNDMIAHTESQALPLGIEIKGFVYQYKSTDNEFLNNAVFTDYIITNRGDQLSDIYAGIWTDFDLGNYSDDHTGCDSLRNMYYAYNADDTDEGPQGYGTNPPATSVMFLDHSMTSYIAGTGPQPKWPYSIGDASYQYLTGHWTDSSSMTYGGDGTGGTTPTKFVYSGNPCTQTGWLEGPFIGDRRSLGNISLGNMLPGEVKKFTVVYLWSRATGGGAIGSLCRLFDQADSLKNWYAAQPPLSVPEPADLHNSIKIFPNPANDKISIETPASFGAYTVAVYDMQGRRVLAPQSTESIDISGLSAGLYYIRIEKGSLTISKKLAKQ